jgi:hypothetical protein
MLDLLLLLLSLCRPARLLSWALCLAGVVALWLTMEKATLRDYIKARARYNTYYEQVQRLQRQQQQYQTELADIKAGGFRLEKTIREQCPLIRPGEKVVYIETPDDRKAAAARQQMPESRVTVGSDPAPAATEAAREPHSALPAEAVPAEDSAGAKPAPAKESAESNAPTRKKSARSAAATSADQDAAVPSVRSPKKPGVSVGKITVRSAAGKAANRTDVKSATKKGRRAKADGASPALPQPAVDTPKLMEF